MSEILQYPGTLFWEVASENIIFHNARVLLDRENSSDHHGWMLCRGCVYIQEGEAWLDLAEVERLPTRNKEGEAITASPSGNNFVAQ